VPRTLPPTPSPSAPPHTTQHQCWSLFTRALPIYEARVVNDEGSGEADGVEEDWVGLESE